MGVVVKRLMGFVASVRLVERSGASLGAGGTEAPQGGQSKNSAGTGKLSTELILH